MPWQCPNAASRHTLTPLCSVRGYCAGLQGRWLWGWKDSIDRSFMARFGSDLDFTAMQQQQQQGPQQGQQQQQVALSAEELALLGAARMRCGGCGSKVGATSLSRMLRRLREDGLLESGGCGEDGTQQQQGEQKEQQPASVLVGLADPDDAAVLAPPPPGHVTVRACVTLHPALPSKGLFPASSPLHGRHALTASCPPHLPFPISHLPSPPIDARQVHTVDFFRACAGDPFVFGAIAANHALGDCFAMGAWGGWALGLDSLRWRSSQGRLKVQLPCPIRCPRPQARSRPRRWPPRSCRWRCPPLWRKICIRCWPAR